MAKAKAKVAAPAEAGADEQEAPPRAAKVPAEAAASKPAPKAAKGEGGVGELISALQERVELQGAELKEVNLALADQKEKLHEAIGDLGRMAAVLGAQFGEPMRTRLANVVLRHQGKALSEVLAKKDEQPSSRMGA